MYMYIVHVEVHDIVHIHYAFPAAPAEFAVWTSLVSCTLRRVSDNFY